MCIILYVDGDGHDGFALCSVREEALIAKHIWPACPETKSVCVGVGRKFIVNGQRAPLVF